MGVLYGLGRGILGIQTKVFAGPEGLKANNSARCA